MTDKNSAQSTDSKNKGIGVTQLNSRQPAYASANSMNPPAASNKTPANSSSTK